MSWQTIADLKGLGLANPRIVGDDLVVDLYDGNELAQAGFVIGNVRGPQGVPSTLDFDVVPLEPGVEPTLVVTGEPGDYRLTLGMPTGPAWDAVAVPVAPGGDPTVAVDEDWPVSTLTIGVPEGVQGEVGPPAQMAVTVSTLPPGESATATLTGEAPNFTLELGIPRGDTGAATAAFDDDVTSSETGWTSQKITAFTSTAINNLAAGFTTALAGKADTSHTHALADVDGLAAALADKAAASHTHAAADVTSGTFAAARIPAATQAQAEAGTAGTAFMTPQRTRQAVTEFLKPYRPRPDAGGRAVFIGASNSVSSSWTATVSAHFGWTQDNYAVGGTGFLSGGVNNWRAQADRVYDDYVTGAKAALRDEVRFVFVAGGGVDAIRQELEIDAEALYVYGRLRDAFPNARCITVPGLWRHIPVRPTILDVSIRMRQAAMRTGWEVIWHGWEWLYGRNELMAADNEHPNADGYRVFADHIIQGILGGDTALALTGTFNHNGTWNASGTSVRCYIEGGLMHLSGYVVRTSASGSTEVLEQCGQITSIPHRPVQWKAFTALVGGANYMDGRVEDTGFVRFRVPPGSNWSSFDISWPVGQ